MRRRAGRRRRGNELSEGGREAVDQRAEEEEGSWLFLYYAFRGTAYQPSHRIYTIDESADRAYNGPLNGRTDR